MYLAAIFTLHFTSPNHAFQPLAVSNFEIDVVMQGSNPRTMASHLPHARKPYG
jgi:hypothetical protein